MTPLRSLLWVKARIIRHWVTSVRRESKLKVAFVSISATLLWLGGFWLARSGFRLFENLGAELTLAGPGPSLSDLVVSRLLSAFALALFVMLVVSNVLVAFATFYRSNDVSYLIQSPVSVASLFLAGFADCIAFSSWASAFLGAPVLLAYGLERGAAVSFYLAVPLFYLPFVAIPAAAGALLTLLLVRLFSGLRRGNLVALGVVTILALFALFRTHLRAPDLSDAATFQAVLEIMGRSQSPFLPSAWTAQGLLAAAAGELGETTFYLLLLLANALLMIWIAVQAAEAWFYPGWSNLLGGESGRVRSVGLASRFLETVLRPIPQPARSLVGKDIRLFWRDPAQWSQFLLFFGLMALYIANLRGSSSTVFQHELWRGWIALLNMAACMLILATLTTRFIYPLISLEGRRFWILGLAPVRREGVVWQKYWLSVGITSVFMVALAVLSGLQLELDRATFLLLLLSIVATTLALSGLAVGLGSLFPNFREDNPARITSGMGGTLNFLLSMLYIVLVTGGQAVIVHWAQVGQIMGGWDLAWATTAVVAGIILLTLVTLLVPMTLGIRNLKRAEF